MKFDSEDPRFTSYLLDELSPSEREEVETLLATDPEAREFLDSLRMTTDALAMELADGAPEQLDQLRRARIVKAASARPRRGLLLAGGGLAAAATILIVVGIGTKNHKLEASKSQSSDVAMNSVPAPAFEMTATGTSSAAQTTSAVTESAGADRSANRNGLAASDTTTVNERFNQDPAAGNVGHHARATGQYAMTGADKNANGTMPPGVRVPQDPSIAGGGGVVGNMQGDSLGYGYIGRTGAYQDYHYYEPALDNPFIAVASDALSTFSVDVDTASYSQVRRYLRGGSLPPPSMVRIEELINYFSYDYTPPKGDEPFAVATEVAQAPWAPNHKLVRIGVKAREVVPEERARANLVFLLDVSGSMRSDDKLPLLKKSFEMLLRKLDAEDRIAIVVYAGASGLALPSTSVSKNKTIQRALARLKSGGSTNGGAGIELAYKVAEANFVEGGINRVILATDGDFNVGTSSREGLIDLIEQKARSNVFLTVLGVGMSSIGDGTMEQLADKGNGNYAYIDTLAEAKKVLVDQIHATLVTVAKDVKLQIEFNPKRVASYRLIGYENRVLANEDFNDDSKDAGEIGAGHTVTALYEIIAPGSGKVDALRYQTTTATSEAADSDELLTLKLRYKEPAGSTSIRREHPVYDSENSFSSASADFKFASAVAAFGMILRNSENRGNANMGRVLEWASESRGSDPHEYRAEFIQLIRRASRLRR